MPTYTIGGKRVTTQSALTDEQIDEIASDLTAPTTAATIPPPPEEPVAGIVKGVGEELSGMLPSKEEILKNVLIPGYPMTAGMRAIPGMVQELGEEWKKVPESKSAGEAAFHGAAGMLPWYGPLVSRIAEASGEGRPYEATGRGLVGAATLVGPKAMPRKVPYGAQVRGAARAMTEKAAAETATGKIVKAGVKGWQGAGQPTPEVPPPPVPGRSVTPTEPLPASAVPAPPAGAAPPTTAGPTLRAPAPPSSTIPTPPGAPRPNAMMESIPEWRRSVEAMQERIKTKGGTPLSEAEAADEAANLALRADQLGPNFGEGYPPKPRWQAHRTNYSRDPSTGEVVKTTKQELATFPSETRIPVQDFAKRLGGKRLKGTPTGEAPARELANAEAKWKQYVKEPKEGLGTFTTEGGDMYYVNVQKGKITDFAVVDSENTLTRRVRGGRHDPSLKSKGMQQIMDKLYDANVKLDPSSMSEGAIKSWLRYLKNKLPPPPKK